MLFTYSPQSLAENWLNSTIVSILSNGMQAILNGEEVPRWPDMIPIDRQEILKNRRGIRDRLTKFWQEFSNLEQPNQTALITALEQQTSLPNILFNDVECIGINNFPDGIKDAADNLFRFLFEEQLTTIKIGNRCLRDIHYESIYSNIPSRICPFCGLGYLRAPGAPRHALDHYMPISKYPFAGADFRNLPPMCSECNSDFKKNTDILVDEHNHRRHCVDPYSGPFFEISLAESVPFAGNIQGAIRLPRWEIKFVGNPQEQAENWNRIFKIKERYERDVLNADFRSWLEHFAFWYSNNYFSNSGDNIAASIPEYITIVIQGGLADRAFLKSEVFRLIENECHHPERGDDIKMFLHLLIINT